MSGDYTILKPLLKRYGADEIVIAEAIYDKGILAGIMRSVGESKIPESGKNIVTDFIEESHFFDIAEEFVRSLRQYKIEQDKLDKLLNYTDIMFKFETLSEWLGERKFLEDIEVVKKIEITEISTGSVSFKVYHKDEFAIFAGFLYKNGLELIEAEGFWYLNVI